MHMQNTNTHARTHARTLTHAKKCIPAIFICKSLAFISFLHSASQDIEPFSLSLRLSVLKCLSCRSLSLCLFAFVCYHVSFSNTYSYTQTSPFLSLCFSLSVCLSLSFFFPPNFSSLSVSLSLYLPISLSLSF